jgi:hypothetical protein
MIIISTKPYGCEVAVYALYTITGELLFIGCDILNNVFKLTQAKRNDKFRELIVENNRAIKVDILRMFDDMTSAKAYATVETGFRQPWCNIHGKETSTYANGGRVRCMNDNCEYDNAFQASKHYGINQSQLSNHLNNRPGYKTVRGLTFTRI